MIDLLITKTDFDQVRQVSQHCSYEVLTDYIRERQNIDFTKFLGNAFYLDILTNKALPDYLELLDGSTFTDCNSDTVQHFGLKRVLIHLAYAAYIIEGGYTSTQFGMVQKMHNDSVPVPMGELTNLHNRNRRLGTDYLEMTKNFLCQNKDKFPLYKGDCDCFALPISTRSSTFKIIRKNGSNRDNVDRRCDF